MKTSKPGKVGGFLKMASGSGPSKDVHEVKARYTLFATGNTASPRASGDLCALVRSASASSTLAA